MYLINGLVIAILFSILIAMVLILASDKFQANPGAYLDTKGNNDNLSCQLKEAYPGLVEDTAKGIILTSINEIIIIVILLSILIFIILFIYRNKRHERLMEHRIRGRILNYISIHPGADYMKIMTDLHLRTDVLTRHLNMLEHQCYINSSQNNLYRKFYLNKSYID